jgi:hypothetical protein
MPTTNAHPPTIPPRRRSSGGGNPRHVFMSCGYRRELRMSRRAPRVPMPTPMKISPFCAMVKPRFSMKMMGKASNTV